MRLSTPLSSSGTESRSRPLRRLTTQPDRPVLGEGEGHPVPEQNGLMLAKALISRRSR